MRWLTDDTGSVVGSASYDTFGAPAGTTGATSSFGYAGERVGAGGLLDLRARAYDPATGRFTSADSLLRSAPGTAGLNRWAYVGDNPTDYVDPSGHEELVEEAGLVNAVQHFVWATIVLRISQEIVPVRPAPCTGGTCINGIGIGGIGGIGASAGEVAVVLGMVSLLEASTDEDNRLQKKATDLVVGELVDKIPAALDCSEDDDAVKCVYDITSTGQNGTATPQKLELSSDQTTYESAASMNNGGAAFFTFLNSLWP